MDFSHYWSFREGALDASDSLEPDAGAKASELHRNLDSYLDINWADGELNYNQILLSIAPSSNYSNTNRIFLTCQPGIMGGSQSYSPIVSAPIRL